MPICVALKVVLDLASHDGGMKRTQLIAVAGEAVDEVEHGPDARAAHLHVT